MVGRCISYWNSPFLGNMLVFRGLKHWFGKNHCLTPFFLIISRPKLGSCSKIPGSKKTPMFFWGEWLPCSKRKGCVFRGILIFSEIKSNSVFLRSWGRLLDVLFRFCNTSPEIILAKEISFTTLGRSKGLVKWCGFPPDGGCGTYHGSPRNAWRNPSAKVPLMVMRHHSRPGIPGCVDDVDVAGPGRLKEIHFS